MKEQILEIIKRNGECTPSELAEGTGLSRQMVHRYLHEFLQKGMLLKIGTPPRVFYQYLRKPEPEIEIEIEDASLEILKANFIQFTDNGKMLKGIDAFADWCKKRNLPLEKTIKEFIVTLKKYKQFRNSHGWIDGTEKLKSTKRYEKICVKKLFYGDFYAIERFGKTPLGQMLHIAKQSQNKKLVIEISQIVKNEIIEIIEKYKIEAIGYIPPTIQRNVQFMHVLKQTLRLPVTEIEILKIKGEYVIPQKALSKIEERIENARKSITSIDKRHYKRVLLIDDAVGSGATINETACKLIRKQIAAEVYGFAVVGSFKGFEVINEA